MLVDMDLATEIRNSITSTNCTPEVRREYLERLVQGKLTREENPVSHFCSYFLPYNTERKEVFLEAHKKSGLWLSPGGHIDVGETPLETAQREIREELGTGDVIAPGTKPLLLTITYIDRDPRGCTTHFDIWHFVRVGDIKFNTAKEDEFDEARWMSLKEARRIVKEENTLKALDFVEKNFFGIT